MEWLLGLRTNSHTWFLSNWISSSYIKSIWYSSRKASSLFLGSSFEMKVTLPTWLIIEDHVWTLLDKLLMIAFYKSSLRCWISLVLIPHSGIKTTISCQLKNRVINFFFRYIFMVFVLKSTKISTESPLCRKVPSYRHLTCLHF